MRFKSLQDFIKSIKTDLGKEKEQKAISDLSKEYSQEVLLDTVNFLCEFGCPPYGKVQTYPATYLITNIHLLNAVQFEKNRSKDTIVEKVTEIFEETPSDLEL